MKAAVYYSNSDVRLQELTLPVPENGGILIRTACCGVCVADTMEWYNIKKAPVVLGHEATGTIAEIQGQAGDLQPGDRVFVHHHIPCLTCDACRQGHFTVCNTFRTTRYDPGGFAEYFAATTRHAAIDTLKLPDHVGFDEGTLIEPLACVIHAVRRLFIAPDHHVAIIGAGAIGLLFLQALEAYGLRNIAVFERDAWRLQRAHELGADAYSAFEKRHIACFDRVLVIAKDIGAMELGLSLAAPGAEVLLFATPEPDEYLKFFVQEAFFRQLRVTLSYSADHLDTREALRLISFGMVDAKSLITHRFALSDAGAAISQTAARGACLKCIVEIG